MDDISEKLAELLNDPDSLNRVREMAENILGNNTAAPENQSPFNNNPASLFDGFDFVPHQEEFFADLYLHPKDNGFKYYFENLAQNIKDELIVK